MSAGVTAGALIACASDGRPDPGPGSDPDPDPTPNPDPAPMDPQQPQNPMSPDGGTPPTTARCESGTRVTIGTNHGHILVVSAADVQAGTERAYDITGTSDHPHTVTVTEAMFESLGRGLSVSVVSTRDDGHTHGVTIVCA